MARFIQTPQPKRHGSKTDLIVISRVVSPDWIGAPDVVTEIGYIVRHGSKSAWSAFRGIGAASIDIGTPTYSKSEAIARVTGA